MPSIGFMLVATLDGLALSATPGPSMLHVLSRTVGQIRSAGFDSTVGLCLGGVLLAVATAWGLGTIFMALEGLVTALRYCGAAYLTWLGLSMMRDARVNAGQELAASTVARQSLARIMWQGVLVELLNPNTVLFFALFLPPFVASDPGAGNLPIQLLVPLAAISADLVVAWLGGTMARALDESRKVRDLMGWRPGPDRTRRRAGPGRPPGGMG